MKNSNIKERIFETLLPKGANFFSKRNSVHVQVNYRLARGAASIALRNINLTLPHTWEFSGFSQNGEDGIIDVLLQHLNENHRYFIEIGSSNGLENNTAWLGHVRNFNGLAIEGAAHEHEKATLIKPWYVDCLNLFVNLDNLEQLDTHAMSREPDLFSLDIDGVDYHILQRLLQLDFRPKIIVVEYNSAFGPDEALTVPYQAEFSCSAAHPSKLYYGVSIQAWRSLLISHGYQFVCVDLNGVNAFFIKTDQFNDDFVNNIEGYNFRENAHQLRKFKANWKTQFEIIKDQDLLRL